MINLLKGYLDQEEWHTKEQILQYLLDEHHCKVNERSFREYVQKYNDGYCENKHDSFIAHSGKGYLLTSDKDIIEKSMKDDLSRLIKLSKRVYGIKRRFKDQTQMTLFPKEEMDAYEVLMRMKV